MFLCARLGWREREVAERTRPLHRKRQPAACEVGGQAATVIGQRAQAGARKLYQIITDKRASDHTGSISGGENVDPSVVGAAPRDTLTPDDLMAQWHAPPTP